MEKILLNDLSRQYNSIKEEIDSSISQIINNCHFIGGEEVINFENNFAKYHSIKHCIGCANGTDAIEIALNALGVQAGDEVLVPSITWISTAGAVRNMGGTPIFVDVDEQNLIDLDSLPSKITKNTKGVIPVHLFGQPVNMPRLLEITNKHNLFVIEDCAQAHGAEINGKMVGTFGDIATFSFYPGKNLGAYGDAGGIITNRSDLDEKCRMIRNHGQRKKHDHVIVGRNSRLDTLQAAVLDVKLKHLNEWTQKRIDAAELYRNLLKDTPVTLPEYDDNFKHVYHLFVLYTDQRDDLMAFLTDNGIQSAIHYPTPLPHTNTFKEYANESFPNAEKNTKTCLSIPIFPEIKKEEIEYVADKIRSFFN